MRVLTFTIFALILSLVIPEQSFAAKRFGGGFSTGKSFTTQKKVAPAPSSPKATNNTQQSPNAAPTQRPRSGFGGLLGGLLAGGLLGALFFGGAFDGIQFTDILILAVIGFIIYKFFFSRKKAAPREQYNTAAAGHGGSQQWGGNWQQQQPAQPAPQPFMGNAQSAGSDDRFTEIQVPSWFNKEQFLKGACAHFKTLQKAWDSEDWTEIATYTSPELLRELQGKRAEDPGEQSTVVESVMSDLVGFIEKPEEVVVSVHFYGWIREGANQPSEEFSEVWHLTRDMKSPNANWYLVGIDQPQG